MRLFAAVDVGSYETGMKIFELSRKDGVKEIDYIRRRVDLGTDSYHTGKFSYERMDELCSVLKGFKEIICKEVMLLFFICIGRLRPGTGRDEDGLSDTQFFTRLHQDAGGVLAI